MGQELGIRVERGTPSALFQLLCAALLASARIDQALAIRAARPLEQGKGIGDVGVDIIFR